MLEQVQIKRVEPGRTLSLLYHELRPGKSDYSYVVDCDAFRQEVELFARLRENAVPDSVCPEITFDDGHVSNRTYAAPILEKRGLRAHFFITVGWTGTNPGYMGWDELRSLLAAGHRIGAHGWTHKLLTHCTDGELEQELNEARKTLEDRLGVPVDSMSLPGGRMNSRVIAACRAAGYAQVFTSIPRAESVGAPPLVGRLNVRAGMTLAWMERLFAPNSAMLRTLERRYRIKQAAKALLGDDTYASLWAKLNRQEA